MRAWIYTLISGFGISDQRAEIITSSVILVLIVLVGLVAYFIANKSLNYYSRKIADKTTTKIDDKLIEKGVFRVLAYIAPALTVYYMLALLGDWALLFEEVIISLIIGFIIVAIFRILDALVDSVKSRSKSKAGPLKGIVSVVKIVLGVVAALLIVITFLGNERGWAIFSSIGGLSAVLLLVFRDSILGLVAGFQLSSEGLLKLGDWLEMPKYNADGEVVDISLTKIKVKNWDKTYTSIPAYRFLEDSFKNWEGMTETGGRRIKRSIAIDMNTIGFLNEAQLLELEEIDVLKPYFKEKREALEQYNKSVNSRHIANQRQLTNVGTFRAYVEAYLKNSPKVHQKLTLMVRQLKPTEQGLPIEVYCFTNDTAWANYESFQSDLFDHILAVLPSFGLKPFQEVSGVDIQIGLKKV